MVPQAQRAAVEFILQYRSGAIGHTDRHYFPRIDFWRDFFPGRIGETLAELPTGQSCSQRFAKGEMLPDYDLSRRITFPASEFNCSQPGSHPQAGRFYPRGCAWRPLDSFPENTAPFLVLESDRHRIIADLNHPLAGCSLTVEARLIEWLPPTAQRGGSAHDLIDELTGDGPGLQRPVPGFRKSYRGTSPFRRDNEDDDADFYRTPRLVHHLDETARRQLRQLYGRLLTPGDTILDLMASWDSHLDESFGSGHLVGLGLNRRELDHNPLLSERTLTDLNRSSRLPYADRTFDGVICTASIEYLREPYELISEVGRILRPEGICAITVSDRWFPGKQIHPWADLHPFERQGLILDLFLEAGCFTGLQTASIRGYPRPESDKYSQTLAFSDPLFIVWGYRT